MSLYEDFLIDGTSVQSAARILEVWDGVHTAPQYRGDSGLIIPGAEGEADLPQLIGSGVVQIGLVVGDGASITTFNDAYRALKQLVKPGRQVTLTRKLSLTAANEDHTATAKYLSGLDVSMQDPADARLVLAFTLQSGVWYGASASLTPGSYPADVTAAGEVRTRKITLTLPGAGTLTNTTTGSAVTVPGSCTLAVLTKTVTAGSVTPVQVVAAGDPFLGWFTLDPGTNHLTWSGGGTPSLSYYPAYL